MKHPPTVGQIKKELAAAAADVALAPLSPPLPISISKCTLHWAAKTPRTTKHPHIYKQPYFPVTPLLWPQAHTKSDIKKW